MGVSLPCPTRASCSQQLPDTPQRFPLTAGNGMCPWNVSLGHRRTSVNPPHFRTHRSPLESLAAEGQGMVLPTPAVHEAPNANSSVTWRGAAGTAIPRIKAPAGKARGS